MNYEYKKIGDALKLLDGVADLLRTLEIPFEVANTNHDAWKWNKSKNKCKNTNISI